MGAHLIVLRLRETRQGYNLAPTFFGLYFIFDLKRAFIEVSGDVFIRIRNDGSLFSLVWLNLKRLRAMGNKTNQGTHVC